MVGVPEAEVETFKNILGGIDSLMDDEDKTHVKIKEIQAASGVDLSAKWNKNNIELM